MDTVELIKELEAEAKTKDSYNSINSFAYKADFVAGYVQQKLAEKVIELTEQLKTK